MRQARGYLIRMLGLAAGALSLGAAHFAPANALPVACDADALVAAIHSANGKEARTRSSSPRTAPMPCRRWTTTPREPMGCR